MKYPTIRIEGAILATDILDKIETSDGITGQKPADFKIEGSDKVKDEIARAWADAQSYWGIFKRKRELLEPEERQTGTTETRNQWMIPFLGLLGYTVEFSRKEEVMGKSYAISHRDKSLDGFPMHIMGFKDSLDVKRKDGGPRMSPHALVQEYLNLTEHLYAIVTNGLQIRLLRDSSRLIKLSFLEFDLERMMDEEHYADFAILYRLLHFTRMPISQDAVAESLIETYHTNSLESGSRIREGLSKAVESSILSFSKGFLQHPKNDALRQWLEEGETHDKSQEFYQWQLRLIYRLLFLMVIEERDLIFPKEANKKQRDIYYDYYSINKLRKLSEKRYLADSKYSDYWQSIQNTFKLFEDEKFGNPLGILPLSGDLFSYRALGVLNESAIDNKVVLECLKNLSIFKNPATQQIMRVNYASLNVEEFGSVYEGLLEYDPSVIRRDGKYYFEFIKGDDRSSSGSHYTPDELVQPLIKHSLDYIIQDKLKEDNKEAALLSITVCDVACGSGHILLNAARRIATELAVVRTGEDQPSPSAFRAAIRDVIRHCIYGVDLNPLAVELCKVALWLEAHNPNEPLNFLDHHIKCGNAIVGLAHFKELENGVADEAFKTLPSDEKEIATIFRNKNKAERKTKGQLSIYDLTGAKDNLNAVKAGFAQFLELPEGTPEEISTKSEAYKKLTTGKGWYRLKQLADLQVAQFFITKTEDNKEKLTTDAKYRTYLNSGAQIQDRGAAIAKSAEKRFFHWFLEFPEVFSNGGFDCILGNPPYLGGKKLRGAYGDDFLNCCKSYYYPAVGQVDLVAFFIRRNLEIIKKNGFISLVTTNSISEGATRESGLQFIMNKEGYINFAIKQMPWPGEANLTVALFSFHKGSLNNNHIIQLNNNQVDFINSFFTSGKELGEPYKLKDNSNLLFKGDDFSGEGFILSYQQGKSIIEKENKNKQVVIPFVNGKEVNNSTSTIPCKFIIDFKSMDIKTSSEYSVPFEIIKQRVKPAREEFPPINSWNKKIKEFWWLFGARRENMHQQLKSIKYCFTFSVVTKHMALKRYPSYYCFSNAVNVITDESYAVFGLIQSSIHDIWTRKYSSQLETRLRYVATKSFETFPFPKSIEAIEAVSSEFYRTRESYAIANEIGLTQFYNEFNSKSLKDERLSKLRRLYSELNNQILSGYSWHQDSERWGKAINLRHDFYEVDYLSGNDRVRYTIHPEARTEVLKRLLLLNHEMHEAEERGITYEELDTEKILEIYKGHIKSWLPENNSLHAKTLKFLSSSEELRPVLESSTSQSYKPFVNQYCSALENEIQQKIFVAFNQQFQNKWLDKEEERNSFLKEQMALSPKATMLFKALKANSDKYTLGNMHFFLNLIWNENSNTVKASPLMQEFKTFVFKQYSDKFINKETVAKLDAFIKKFRNESAHTGEVDKKMAIECMHEVRGFIKLLVDSEIVEEKKVEVKPTKKKTRKTKSNVVKEPSSNSGQGKLF